MATNPIFIPAVFAVNGVKNIIRKVRETGQDAQDFTWESGAPPITMIPTESGGKAPKGQDFNGVLNALSAHIFHAQKGEGYKFDTNIITEFGGYEKGAIIQSDDREQEFQSLVDNNTTNPNTGLDGRWIVYTGRGVAPIATSTTAGIMKVLNVLTSTDVGSALSANMGKFIYDRLLGNGQQLINYWVGGNSGSDSRKANTLYRNNTGRTITVFCRPLDTGNINSVAIRIELNGFRILDYGSSGRGSGERFGATFVVPAEWTYEFKIVSDPTNTENLPISELR